MCAKFRRRMLIDNLITREDTVECVAERREEEMRYDTTTLI